ncbi:hypothetical protein BHYA_0059g00280 [Botrytis hyacinthi]|uniref:Uncharacterized protein n=1 Tax=Botrytis hyacinthi TaxID=278943 RepID=A0A4Z1GVG7_9HELO|nr:hypothetical protein BHYA_0059g00280 [Botrytis hyacinthi]
MCWSANSRNPGKAAYLAVLGRGYRQLVHAISTRLNPIPSSHLASTGASSLPSTSHSKTLSTLSSLSSTPTSDDRPDPPSGIEVLETTLFRLQCFQTLTGTKLCDEEPVLSVRDAGEV